MAGPLPLLWTVLGGVPFEGVPCEEVPWEEELGDGADVAMISALPLVLLQFLLLFLLASKQLRNDSAHLYRLHE